ncbi:MAG: YccF domain-containing protein [Flavisolibacter sp.]
MLKIIDIRGQNYQNNLQVNTLGNIIWLLFGGLLSAIAYCVGGFVLCLTILGIPFGFQCFKMAGFVLWPFGRMAINKDTANGPLSLLFNIIWILCGGLWLAIGHLVMGILLFLTVVGIPFARQHFKLVEISLMPFGKQIVDK